MPKKYTKKKKKAQALQTETTEIKNLADRLAKFSSWSRATRDVARLLRRAKKVTSHALSTVSERENAEHVIIRDLQKQEYEEEIKLLSRGLLKVEGRLHHSFRL